MTSTSTQTLVQRLVIDIDEKGIGNTWPVFADAGLFTDVVTALAEPFRADGITKVVGVEARGFVLGAAVARELNAGFVGIRKPGGLYPGATFEHRTPPDYRGNEFVLRLQTAAVGASDRVLLVDDWFETGGQASAALELIRQSGATYCGASIIVDWLNENLRERLGRVESLVDIVTLPAG